MGNCWFPLVFLSKEINTFALQRDRTRKCKCSRLCCMVLMNCASSMTAHLLWAKTQCVQVYTSASILSECHYKTFLKLLSCVYFEYRTSFNKCLQWATVHHLFIHPLILVFTVRGISVPKTIIGWQFLFVK